MDLPTISGIIMATVLVLALDYYTLSKASQFYLKTKQDHKVLIKTLFLSLLANFTISLLDPSTMPSTTSLENVSFSPFWLIYLVIPALIYQWMLRNQAGHRLNAKQTLGLYAVKLLLFIPALLILAVIASIIGASLFLHQFQA